MFNAHRKPQFDQYNFAINFFKQEPERLIAVEKFATNWFKSFLSVAKEEILRDYNEASFLFPFWQNYPPDERGRMPRGDQFPWIEVGEHVFCPKISRYLQRDFYIRDTGIPTGPDDRYVVSSDPLLQILKITNSIWLFIDIKSVGPRDDQDHAVMSHNQISGNGKWDVISKGVLNDTIMATGPRATHPFHCAVPPLFVLSDNTIAPVVHIVIKPVYKMLSLDGEGQQGQPLERVSLVSIPNGILLLENPNYLRQYPGLLFPGKDKKNKNPKKLRARISFEILRKINSWRYSDFDYLIK